jgi:hypothetical protein
MRAGAWERAKCNYAGSATIFWTAGKNRRILIIAQV